MNDKQNVNYRSISSVFAKRVHHLLAEYMQRPPCFFEIDDFLAEHISQLFHFVNSFSFSCFSFCQLDVSDGVIN